MADHISLAPAEGTIVIRAGGAIVAESASALMMTEGAYAPVLYLPRQDVAMAFFDRSDTLTQCPHKGSATHFDMVGKSGVIQDAAWSYETPLPAMAAIAGHIAFYPDKVTIETL